MKGYTEVDVITESDGCGQALPAKIVCVNKGIFPIKRILHICQPEDMVVRYTVLIGKEQRHLFHNGDKWCISDIS